MRCGSELQHIDTEADRLAELDTTEDLQYSENTLEE
jgi:hypothetical protein